MNQTLESLAQDFIRWSDLLIDEVADQFQIFTGQASDVIDENPEIVNYCWEHNISAARTARKLLKAQ